MEKIYDNPNVIPIPEPLNNYINRLFYEKYRLLDLMNIIDRSFTDFTNEEWLDSYQYFENKLNEAILSFDIGMDCIYDMYKDQIGNAPWEVNFDFSCILLNKYKIKERSRPIQYSDQLAKIYDDFENKGPMEIGITFGLS